MDKGPEQTPLPRRHTNSQQIYEKMFHLTSYREMQVKTILRHQLTSVRTAISNKTSNNKYRRGCGEKEPSFTAGGNVDWCSHYGKQSGGSSKN